MTHTFAFSRSLLLALTATLTLLAGTRAADGPAPERSASTRPATTAPTTTAAESGRLGEKYVSRGIGISLRPPSGCKLIRRPAAADTIEFVNEEKNWMMKASQLRFEKPPGLSEHVLPGGEMVGGLLESTVQSLKDNVPGAVVLRKEVSKLTDGPVGLVAIRYAKATKRLLSQQAIVEVSDRIYYLIALTTPSSKLADDKDEDPAERLAVDTFSEVLDSLEVLDQTEVRQDQEERLIRTRALLVNFNDARLRSALVPDQWLRIIRNGRDIGYSYVSEGIERKGNQDGVIVTLRTRTIPEADTQIDFGSLMFVSMDRRHEDWESLTVVSDPRTPAMAKPATTRPMEQSAEFGSSDRRRVMGGREDYTLNVTRVDSKETASPVTQGLQAFYLQQALGRLLPRLVPLHQPKTYMFSAWEPESRHTWSRYVDVGRERRVDFAGKSVRAVPIEDKLGLDGPITTHYMSPDGEYLGSETRDTSTLMVPTTKTELLKRWKNANLTRPEELPRPDSATLRPPQDEKETRDEVVERPAKQPPARAERPSRTERRATDSDGLR